MFWVVTEGEIHMCNFVLTRPYLFNHVSPLSLNFQVINIHPCIIFIHKYKRRLVTSLAIQPIQALCLTMRLRVMRHDQTPLVFMNDAWYVC